MTQGKIIRKPGLSTSRSHRVRKRGHWLRPWLWRWHRRAGLIAAAILLLVAVTGIMLNHTTAMSLGQQPVRQAWLLAHYGVDLPLLRSYQVGERWLSGDEHGSLYLDGRRLGQCDGALVGAVVGDAVSNGAGDGEGDTAALQGLLLAACERELLLLTAAGDIVERLTAVHGLPVPVARIGSCQPGVCLFSDQQVISADLQQLRWQGTAASAVWSQPGPLPAALAEVLWQGEIGTELSWERVILDLHSGRIGGDLGVWLVDLAAILMVFLSFSGFYLWLQQALRRSSRHRS
nr:PepSY-associated TM helix domain-containing protein [Pseudomaricurvus alcaniphilus]